MKRIGIARWSSVVAAMVVASVAYCAPTYRVLLVGLGDYESVSPFGSLAGASDMELIKQTLMKYWQVPAGQITVMNTPATTTKKAILDAFQTKLIDAAQPGDEIYFAFSGHGTVVPDPSKPSGRSQALIPIDVKLRQVKDPRNGEMRDEIDPSTLITGPEIGKLLADLKKKNITRVTLTFDSCHSGGVTRGTYKARGVENPAMKGLPDNPLAPDDKIAPTTGGAGYVALFATRSDEKAWEDGEVGNFTRALIESLKTKTGSYKQLFDSIRARMITYPMGNIQNPTLEGDAGRNVFSDTFAVSVPTWTAFVSKKAGKFGSSDDPGMRVQLDAGEPAGLRVGYTVGLYAPEQDIAATKPRWIARVSETGSGRCTIELDEESAKKVGKDLMALNGARAVLLDGAPEGTLKIFVEGPAAEANRKLLDDLLAVPMIRLSNAGDRYDIKVVPPTAGTATWQLQDRAGEVIDEFEGSAAVDAMSSKLRARLLIQARKKAVLDLKPSGMPRVTLEVKIVRVQATDRGVAALDTATPPPAGEAGPRDKFAISVRAIGRDGNLGAYDPYVSVLCVNPNPKGALSHVDQIWPTPDSATGLVTSNSTLRRIKSDGKWMYLSVDNGLVDGSNPSLVRAWYVDPNTDGVGLETFKIFATKEAEDFGPLVDPTPGRSRGAVTPLGSLLASFSEGKPNSRAARVETPLSDWDVQEFTLRVR